jgi:DNA-binding MarR family transcriptional regulator
MTKRETVINELILSVFRLNGALIDAGNRLVVDIGLTSAWWQVLGALDLSPVPLPVAHIARNMGLSRQSVQRVADLLTEKGLVRFEANPHHQRAKLMVLTPQGRAAVKGAEQRQRPWARDLAAGVSLERLTTALDVLTDLNQHLARADSTADEDFT